MPRLTVTEKEHWKSRIERRIDNAIEALASQEPGLLPSVKEKAVEAAYKSLGIDGFKNTFVKLESEIKAREDQKSEVERSIVYQVLGKDVEQADYYSRREIEATVNKRQRVHADELLAKSKLGRQILSLRREREELLDTVWLATSSVQIRELWSRVAELLGDEPTNLQRKAIAINPDDGQL